ncbi:hypothetical protein [Streptomyces sp. NBC_00572]|uniref:hypothetical protein n=1 Tax=Streptomyces sp. NBC_00572 TaxID=2903664 RepID=UPI00225495BA|nr:hypothetical protein [Streptomyces sp. NBC_00572]MCX4986149.1 hypothetical protein [Streptomyces sp. NBC_00572]
MGRSARRLTTLLPAMLLAIWSLLVLPAQDPTPATVPTSHMVPSPASVAARAPASGTTVTSTPVQPAPHPATHRASAPEPHFAPTAVVRLTAAVENPVRLPGTPGATVVVPADLSVPARGVLAGDPRRERAPPGAAHGPRAPRGPPSTRHS